MERATNHRVWLGATVALLFGLALTWGLLRFGAAETKVLYRLFLFLSAPLLLALLAPPWRERLDLRLLGTGLLGVILLGLVALQPTLVALGPLHLTVGWIALWLGLWLGLRSPTQRQFLVVVLVLLGALEAFYGLIQSVGGVDYIGDYFRHRGRIATGTLINRNHFAALLNILLPLALGLLLASRSRQRERPATRAESLAKTWIVLLGCSSMGVAVLLSQSRGGTLSLLTTLLLMALLLSMSRRRRASRGHSGLAAVMLLLLVVGMGSALGLEALLERFGRLDEGVSRIEVYEDTLRMIGEAPWTGVGPGMYRWAFRTFQRRQIDQLYDHAHNDYLETAAEWGVPLAVLAWGFVFWRLYRSSVLSITERDAHRQGLALGTAGALFSILVHSLVDFSLQIPSILMVLACIVALSWLLEFPQPGGADGKQVQITRFDESKVSAQTVGPAGALALRLLLIVALLGAGWVVLQRSRAIRAASPEQGVPGLEQAVRIDPTGPEHHFLLGMAYRDLPGAGDPDLALDQLRSAVRLNPYAWRYWLELSRMQELMGDIEEAGESLGIAVRLNPGSGAYRWRLANWLLRGGSTDESVAEMAEAIRLEPYLAEPAVVLLLKAGVDEAVIRDLLPEDPSVQRRLLRTLVSLIGRPASAAMVTPAAGTDLLTDLWSHLLVDSRPITVDEGRDYVDHLLQSGKLPEARQAWIDLAAVNGRANPDFGQGGNRVWNGGFELETMGRPLGWRISRGEAFEIRQSAGGGLGGSGALEIEFLGTENLNFTQVSQVLILEPSAAFRLTLKMRAEDLGTDQGVFVEVSSRNPRGLLVTTEPLLGTTGWTSSEIEFTVPEGSGEAVLRLRRRQSRQIDSRLRGKLWLDSVRIERVNP